MSEKRQFAREREMNADEWFPDEVTSWTMLRHTLVAAVAVVYDAEKYR